MVKQSISQNKSLSIVMPVYNEAPTVKGMITEIISELKPQYNIQLIVVESGSTDGTHEIVKELQSKGIVEAIYQPRPMGKGSAVREGLKCTKNFITLIFDGDREYSARDIPNLVLPILNGDSDFVLGSRFKPGEPMRSFGKNKVRSTILNLVHKFFSTMCNLMYGVNLKDPFTMYKVFRSETIENLHFEEDGFAFDVELVAKLIRSGFKPLEIPVSYKSRGFSEGKKIRFFRDGYALPIALVRHKFSKLNNSI
jgi:glycosyltransferase involved in cell wall biosynthesis